ncbi:MAG: hypothetical protein LBQ37_02545 [Elusimicrobiota bacterium]|nr:hypothetical protein [Elusimicrobiota bacterium]
MKKKLMTRKEYLALIKKNYGKITKENCLWQIKRVERNKQHNLELTSELQQEIEWLNEGKAVNKQTEHRLKNKRYWQFYLTETLYNFQTKVNWFEMELEVLNDIKKRIRE